MLFVTLFLLKVILENLSENRLPIPAPVSEIVFFFFDNSSSFYYQVLPVAGREGVCWDQEAGTDVVNPGALL